MRKRSNTSTAKRSRRASSKTGGRRQTTLRVQTPRTAARRGKAKRGRSASRARRGKSKSSTANITTDYDTIREWAETRGGWPAIVGRTAKGQSSGILRIDFPGFSGAGSLKPISWDDWFDTFDESILAFLYQEKTVDGKQSRFFKLIERE